MCVPTYKQQYKNKLKGVWNIKNLKPIIKNIEKMVFPLLITKIIFLLKLKIGPNIL